MHCTVLYTVLKEEEEFAIKVLVILGTMDVLEQDARTSTVLVVVVELYVDYIITEDQLFVLYY